MPVELLIAAPLTPFFRNIVQKFPQVDDKLHKISDWGLESLQAELVRREQKDTLLRYMDATIH